MRIAIVYNQPQNRADPSETGVIEQTQAIQKALSEAGHSVLCFAVDDALGLMMFLRRERVNLIFNCCETLRGNAAMEMNLAALMELEGIPFTGSSALTLGICANKALAKTLLAAKGIRTPAWTVVRGQNDWCTNHLVYPLIVKPLNEDSSLGIDAASVVATEGAARERARYIFENFRQPALLEEFIDGREFNIAVLADRSGALCSLPISEILFHGLARSEPKIVTYDAKWTRGSPYYEATVPQCPADIPPAWADELRSTTLAAANALQIRHYGRVDFRVRDADEGVFVLEVNPNPDISADSGFARAAQAGGRTHAEFIREIAAGAFAHGVPDRA